MFSQNIPPMFNTSRFANWLNHWAVGDLWKQRTFKSWMSNQTQFWGFLWGNDCKWMHKCMNARRARSMNTYESHPRCPCNTQVPFDALNPFSYPANYSNTEMNEFLWIPSSPLLSSLFMHPSLAILLHTTTSSPIWRIGFIFFSWKSLEGWDRCFSKPFLAGFPFFTPPHIYLSIL